MRFTATPRNIHPLSRRSRISVGVLTMLASLHAHGQDTAATTSADGKSADSVVVVTGFRASLNSAPDPGLTIWPSSTR